MFEFYLNNNRYELPDRWEELTLDQFLTLVDLLHRYKLEIIDYFDLKVMFVMKILGIKPRRIRSAEKRQLRDENLYKLSEQVDFFLQVVYTNKEKFKRFSEETKKLLKKKLPEEIDGKNPEIRIAKKMKRYYDVDAVFLKNLLPEIRIGRQRYQGYQIESNEGIATTTLKAMQFSDALTITDSIIRGKQHLIPTLIGILYQRDGYSEHLARERAEIFKNLPETTKQAVFLNFVAVREYITLHTKYKILFERSGSKKKKKSKYSNGLADSVDTLVKLGYGTGEEMENKNLFRFLDLIIKSLQDAIRTALSDENAKKADVANKLDISIELINELE